MTKFYMDACCYNRPLDNQRQQRIYYESQSILTLIWRSYWGYYELIGSEALLFELRNPLARLLFHFAVRDIVRYDLSVKKRAKQIRAGSNIKEMDSVHLASAEAAGVNVFLTTDDRLIKACAKIPLPYRVLNPVIYLFSEVLNDDDR